ncbi:MULTISPECIES: ABC transporter permease [unclassified Streptomyces]|uniref:ABC transporter permease n=1 Tax=unclassified Streptomyces TaxID=2593676 RepID=UPI002237C6F1|nr:ABC transporter permease [Streptomyces sp. SHP 1-2]
MRTLLTKAGWGLATALGASLLAFLLMRVLPGDPARLAAGELASEETVRAQETAMGLDQPIPVQYVKFLTSFFQGDWGFAYSVGQPARHEITSRLPASLELGLFAFAIAVTTAVCLAVLATYSRRAWVDRLVRGVSSIGLGTPQFWLGLILLVLFSQALPLLPGPEGRLSPGFEPPPSTTGLHTVDALLAGEPATAWNAVQHLILPGVVLALVPCAFLIRLLRGNLLESLRGQYMVVLRAKGVSRRASFVRHAFPNAALPTITAAGLVLAEMLAGSVLTEKVFGWPGVGSLVVDSILRKDFAVVQAFVFLSAIAYVVLNTVVDLLYGVIDPRIRSAAR